MAAMRPVLANQAVFPEGKLVNGPVLIMFRDDGHIHQISFDELFVKENGKDALRCHTVVPGFVDIHTHGCGGTTDLASNWTEPEYNCRKFASYGTTSCLASITFPKADPKLVDDTVEAVREYMQTQPHAGCSNIEGIHAEGPIVADYGGLPVSDTELGRDAFVELLDSLPALKAMTIAPHADAKGDYARLKVLLERGVLPCLGHDKQATEEEILGALRIAAKAGVRLHLTHAMNVQTFHHRLPSLANFGLTNQFPNADKYEGLVPPTIEVIGDMQHLHPLTLSMILRARDPEAIAFITDSVMSFSPGLKATYAGREVECCCAAGTSSTGLVRQVDDQTISGSCANQNQILKSLVLSLRVPLERAVQMLAEVPARIVGLDHIGRLEEGKRGDLALLDERMDVIATVVAGQVAYEKSSE